MAATLIWRRFWPQLAVAAILAIVTAVPTMMSSVMDRGYEIAKLSVAYPAAFLAVLATLLAGNWTGLWRRCGPAVRTAVVSLAAFLVLASISTAMSEMPGASLFGGYFRREGLLAWGCYAAFAFAAFAWAQRPAKVQQIVDVLLLASLIPLVYAFQQHLDFDFFFVANRDITRPNGTLGNAIFLAAYYAILIPLTAARLWAARQQRGEAILWGLLLILQFCTLLITQSRGPLLATFLGLTTLGCLAAARYRRRSILVAVFVLAAAVTVPLVLINISSPVKGWAQEVPVIGRLVFTPTEAAANGVADLARRSSMTRLGIWHAGVEAFAAAPAERKLFGYGPEAAYMHYFGFMPASVMQFEGFWESNSFDRLHADTLDVALNLGLLSWLAYGLFFAATVYAASVMLFRVEGRAGAPIWFCLASLLGGFVGGSGAVAVGLPAAAVPAVGLGIGAGWSAYLVARGWLWASRTSTAGCVSMEWGLAAGLVSALLVFWYDAQVNIPVLTTRLLSFGCATFLLALARRRNAEGGETEEESTGDRSTLGWGCGFMLVAALASFWPVIDLDASLRAQESARTWLLLVPMAVAIGFVMALGWVRGVVKGKATPWLVPLFLPVSLFAIGHGFLAVSVGKQIDSGLAAKIALASALGPFVLVAMCPLSAWLRARSEAGAGFGTARVGVGAGVLSVAMALMTIASGFAAWRAISADVASVVGKWAVATGQYDVGEQLVGEAISLMPYERYYRRELIFDLLTQAMEDIKGTSNRLVSYETVARVLATSEDQARETLDLFPNDPWAVVALANVRQVRGLKAIRQFDPASGEDAAAEAGRLFRRAHEMFPTQPLLLRNWAQWQFDQGNRREGFQLLDLMEKLIPNHSEPYVERMVWAGVTGDKSEGWGALERARTALSATELQKVEAVVPIQH